MTNILSAFGNAGQWDHAKEYGKDVDWVENERVGGKKFDYDWFMDWQFKLGRWPEGTVELGVCVLRFLPKPSSSQLSLASFHVCPGSHL